MISLVSELTCGVQKSRALIEIVPISDKELSTRTVSDLTVVSCGGKHPQSWLGLASLHRAFDRSGFATDAVIVLVGLFSKHDRVIGMIVFAQRYLHSTRVDPFTTSLGNKKMSIYSIRPINVLINILFGRKSA
jgi:hypothetical protein